MKYKRLTDRVIAEMLRNTEGESWDSDNIEAQCYIRLAELEDKIESGEIISVIQSEQDEQEIAYFVKHNAAVRKQAVKEFSDTILYNVGAYIIWVDRNFLVEKTNYYNLNNTSER